MPDSLTREQFNVAVADAVTGILNVYREVDAMFRELSAALGSVEPRLVSLLGKRPLVPAAGSRNPDGYYLRNYRAWVFARPNEVEEDEEEEEEEEPEDDEAEGKKKKRPLAIKEGSSLVAVRATVFDRGVTNFEPNLVIGTLLRCRVESPIPAGTELKISRGRFRRVFRAIDQHRGGPAKPVETDVPVTVGSQKKHKLVFDMPAPWTRHALFDVTPSLVQELAAALRSSLANWHS